jgi:hypothetical protein
VKKDNCGKKTKMDRVDWKKHHDAKQLSPSALTESLRDDLQQRGINSKGSAAILLNRLIKIHKDVAKHDGVDTASGRKGYRCRLCGQIKKRHVCPHKNATTPRGKKILKTKVAKDLTKTDVQKKNKAVNKEKNMALSDNTLNAWQIAQMTASAYYDYCGNDINKCQRQPKPTKDDGWIFKVVNVAPNKKPAWVCEK